MPKVVHTIVCAKVSHIDGRGTSAAATLALRCRASEALNGLRGYFGRMRPERVSWAILEALATAADQPEAEQTAREQGQGGGFGNGYEKAPNFTSRKLSRVNVEIGSPF